MGSVCHGRLCNVAFYGFLDIPLPVPHSQFCESNISAEPPRDKLFPRRLGA